MFDPDLRWQPIPVHTIPQKDDIVSTLNSVMICDLLLLLLLSLLYCWHC